MDEYKIKKIISNNYGRLVLLVEDKDEKFFICKVLLNDENSKIELKSLIRFSQEKYSHLNIIKYRKHFMVNQNDIDLLINNSNIDNGNKSSNNSDNSNNSSNNSSNSDTINDNNEKICIVTDYYNHNDLSKVLFLDSFRNNRLSTRDFLPIFLRVLIALAEFEKLDSFHRDIKPENLFIQKVYIDGNKENIQENNVYYDFFIGDFGTFKEVSTVCSYTMAIGTNSFIAPDLFKKSSYDIKADIYSLGKTMAYVTDKLLFRRGVVNRVYDILLQKMVSETAEERPFPSQLIHFILNEYSFLKNHKDFIECYKSPVFYKCLDIIKSKNYNILNNREPLTINCLIESNNNSEDDSENKSYNINHFYGFYGDSNKYYNNTNTSNNNSNNNKVGYTVSFSSSIETSTFFDPIDQSDSHKTFSLPVPSTSSSSSDIPDPSLLSLHNSDKPLYQCIGINRGHSSTLYVLVKNNLNNNNKNNNNDNSPENILNIIKFNNIYAFHMKSIKSTLRLIKSSILRKYISVRYCTVNGNVHFYDDFLKYEEPDDFLEDGGMIIFPMDHKISSILRSENQDSKDDKSNQELKWMLGLHLLLIMYILENKIDKSSELHANFYYFFYYFTSINQYYFDEENKLKANLVSSPKDCCARTKKEVLSEIVNDHLNDPILKTIVEKTSNESSNLWSTETALKFLYDSIKEIQKENNEPYPLLSSYFKDIEDYNIGSKQLGFVKDFLYTNNHTYRVINEEITFEYIDPILKNDFFYFKCCLELDGNYYLVKQFNYTSTYLNAKREKTIHKQNFQVYDQYIDANQLIYFIYKFPSSVTIKNSKIIEIESLNNKNYYDINNDVNFLFRDFIIQFYQYLKDIDHNNLMFVCKRFYYFFTTQDTLVIDYFTNFERILFGRCPEVKHNFNQFIIYFYNLKELRCLYNCDSIYSYIKCKIIEQKNYIKYPNLDSMVVLRFGIKTYQLIDIFPIYKHLKNDDQSLILILKEDGSPNYFICFYNKRNIESKNKYSLKTYKAYSSLEESLKIQFPEFTIHNQSKFFHFYKYTESFLTDVVNQLTTVENFFGDYTKEQEIGLLLYFIYILKSISNFEELSEPFLIEDRFFIMNDGKKNYFYIDLYFYLEKYSKNLGWNNYLYSIENLNNKHFLNPIKEYFQMNQELILKKKLCKDLFDCEWVSSIKPIYVRIKSVLNSKISEVIYNKKSYIQKMVGKGYNCDEHNIYCYIVSNIKSMEEYPSNIVKYHTSYSLNGNSYIVIDKCKGDLKNILDSKLYLNENEMVILLYDLICSLKQLNQFDIVHRDIKPANVLMDKNGKYLLADFELSVVQNNKDVTTGKEVKYFKRSLYDRDGTIHFQSPEIYSLEYRSKYLDNNHNYKMDIYSVGSIFLELLFSFESNVIKKKLDYNQDTFSNLKIIAGKMTLFHYDERIDLLNLEQLFNKSFPNFKR
ncbi:hypothetical protein DICPUDRAFT_75685 [Dictyostelium purpureum]|uniref:mitogen-activated protein kinase kinase n=1 Tax=Dictyostelium purpureum TaxID=5786 RepID=F0ZBD6_DICPU|nr:uncharacterized protein DICPUDRAFT_75685 [Dictyostelium purpureum]EGC38755.1 hypothetical protein DICPUDRAFT_75685 [Dictyostelium purpureum]|eukprot:XP_003284746.1 hypothetical protein DICPUDRAFT_75685 [Dictyostelium purpureum]